MQDIDQALQGSPSLANKLVRAPAWVQGVDQPHQWATQHRWLLEAAFDAFDREGEWPRIEDVQLSLAGATPITQSLSASSWSTSRRRLEPGTVSESS